MQTLYFKNKYKVEILDKKERDRIYDYYCHLTGIDAKVHESSFSLSNFLKEKDKDLSLNY